MQNNKSFVGISFNIPKNKYMQKDSSYEYKLSNAKKFFLTELGNWIRSADVQNGLKNGKVLKVGARRKDKENQKTLEHYEVLEFCVYLGDDKVPQRGGYNSPPQKAYQAPKDDLDDNLEDAPF